MATAIKSTPTEIRHVCGHCTRPSTHSRRDIAGVIYRSCADHQTDMEIMVREINEWDGARESLP
jgi:hypothetical protein